MRNRVITIGREFGSGGHEIGKRLAKDLGIKFYDTEIIELAVKKTGYHEDYVKRNDEKAPDFTIAGLMTGITTEYYQPSPYDQIQLEEYKLIQELAEKESCVIVGRAADYVLRDQFVASVFLFAPLRDRVKRKLALAKKNTDTMITPEEMEKTVKHIDKQRKRYYEYYTESKWGSRDTYDLLLNTSKTGIDGACEIIKTYLTTCADTTIMPD